MAWIVVAFDKIACGMVGTVMRMIQVSRDFVVAKSRRSLFSFYLYVVFIYLLYSLSLSTCQHREFFLVTVHDECAAIGLANSRFRALFFGLVPVSHFASRARVVREFWFGWQWAITSGVCQSRTWWSARVELRETVRPKPPAPRITH